MTTAAAIVGDRYILLGTLGSGGMGMVYEAHDRLENERVALKRVMAPTGAFSVETEANQDLRLALTHEFRTLAGLRHPHIIPVLDYGFSAEGQPFFTMPLVAQARTILQAAEELPIPAKIDLLLQMLGALAYLHRRDILHRDLKPANVLVDMLGQVRVLDFGLSSSGDQHEGVTGTVQYLAPELLNGAPAGPATDIYAAGILAYEVLTGHYPYAGDDIRVLINHILQGRADWEPLEALSQKLPVPPNAPSLAAIVRKMMAFESIHRYHIVEHIIADWCAALSRPLPRETHAVREGYIQAATFVGRDAELDQLTSALQAILPKTTTQGSAWLIGGESGVGKSRLLEELRVRALTAGALVLRGQGVEGGGLPYQVMRDVVRRLVLTVPPTLEEAAILKTIVPDIGDLLGITVPDGVLDDDDKTYLIRTVVDLFRRLTQPVLLLLEDLQWARRSLVILQALVEEVGTLPLMIAASYRTEEWPELPSQVQPMRSLTLTRLSKHSIGEYAHSMLTLHEEYDQVVEFLYRETEGNAFFLVEVMRVLAEEAGTLAAVGQATLPKYLFAGGVEAIIARRLARIPKWDQLLLHIAAVAGRAIDIDLLSAVDIGFDVEDWLTACSNAAVLEVHEGVWRFTHDKLREYILKTLPPKELADLHRVVALAIEKVYPAESKQIYAHILAEHWRAAGDLPKEHFYLASFGGFLSRSGHRTEAVRYLRDATTLFQQLGEAADDATRRRQIMCGVDHGLCLVELNKIEDAIQVYKAARQLAADLGDEVLVATVDYYEWYASMQKGDYAEAEAGFRHNLAWAERIQHTRLIGRALDGLARSVELQNRFAEAVEYLERALSTNATLGEVYPVAYVQIHLGYAYMGMGDATQAQASLQTGLAACRSIGYKSEIAWASLGLALLASQQSDWATCQRLAYEVIEISQQTLDRTSSLNALMLLGRVLVAQGQAQTAAAWLGMAQQSPQKTDLDVQARMAELREDLAGVFDAPSLAQGLACGQTLKLPQVITEVLKNKPV